ncbi:MAG: ATP-binding protein [Thermincolia bacterium]
MEQHRSLRIRYCLLKIILVVLPLVELFRLITHSSNTYFSEINKYIWMVDVIISVLVMSMMILAYHNMIYLKNRIELIRYAKINQMDMVGQLAAGMAHEIRNPLTSVKGFVQLIQQNDTSERKKEYLEVVKSEIRRIEEIINETLLLAQPKASKPEVLDIPGLAGGAVDELQDYARAAGVELILELEQETLSMVGDREKIKLALLNFLRNGIEAIPQGGVVRIHICHVDSDNVGISIQDSGTGMTPEVLERVGTPFYTTKDKGIGLGIMVAFQMIHNHSGYVGIESKPGSGTLVRITLPVKG